MFYLQLSDKYLKSRNIILKAYRATGVTFPNTIYFP